MPSPPSTQLPTPAPQARSDRLRVVVAYLAAALMLVSLLAFVVVSAAMTVPFSRATDRIVLIGIWGAALLQYLVLFFAGMRRMQQFLSKHPEIDTQVALVALKAAVRHNMVLAYPLLVLGLVTGASALLLVARQGHFGYGCMGLFLLANVWATRRMKALEHRVRSVPARGGPCAQAQAAVNEGWKKSLWPNF